MVEPIDNGLRRRKERFLRGRMTRADAVLALCRAYGGAFDDPRIHALSGLVFDAARARRLNAGDTAGFDAIITGLAEHNGKARPTCAKEGQ